MISPLDNPMWQSLTTRHAYLALGDGPCRRYPSEVAPFAGIAESSDEATAALLMLVHVGERVGVLGVHPTSLDGWNVQKEFGIAQYVWEKTGGSVESEPEAIALGPEHLDRMLELTALVYPAYFRKGTAELGDYVGIIENGQLCAMAGIRMSFDGHQEISAVCTHPEHRGKGYASRLSRRLVYQIQSQGDVPFLHTEDDNFAARSVYERLGFTLRKVLPFKVMDRI
jgi:ribosomal protein S18 acetylase RimI-like enzyme